MGHFVEATIINGFCSRLKIYQKKGIMMDEERVSPFGSVGDFESDA